MADPDSDTRGFWTGTGESFFLAVPEIAPGSVLTDNDWVPSPVPAGLKGFAAEQMR